MSIPFAKGIRSEAATEMGQDFKSETVGFRCFLKINSFLI